MTIRKGIFDLWHAISTSKENIVLNDIIRDDIEKILKAIKDIYDPVIFYNLIEEFHIHIQDMNNPHQLSDLFDDKALLNTAYTMWLNYENEGTFEEFLKVFYQYTYIATYENLFDDNSDQDKQTVRSEYVEKYLRETHDESLDVHTYFQEIIKLPGLNKTPVFSYSCIANNELLYRHSRYPGPMENPYIVNDSLPQGYVETDYSVVIHATGGYKPYIFSAQNIPNGFTLTNINNTAVLSGKSNNIGNYDITFLVKDSHGSIGSKTLTLQLVGTVYIPPTDPGLPPEIPSVNRPTITTQIIPNGKINIVYNTTISGTGGTTPYTWSTTGLPSGLSINSSTGVISGTPTVSGTYNVTVVVYDVQGLTDSKTYVIIIENYLIILTDSLPSAIQDFAYSFTLSGSGGDTPYTWYATGLPDGLAIYNPLTGVISGYSTVSGTFSVVLILIDVHDVRVTKTLSLSVIAGVRITTTALPTATTAIAYSYTLAGTGGTTPYTWSTTGLPSGLSINSSTGVISGTPTVSGTYNVTVKLTDTNGSTDTKTYSLSVLSNLVITTTTIPTGTQNSAYSTTISGTGGTTPYTWSTTGLPSGLSINSSTGVISGTPTVSGTYNVTVTLKDKNNLSTSKVFNLILAAVIPPLVINTTSLPSGTQNTAYSMTLSGSGGTGTGYKWSAVSLPSGITCSTSGVISGKTSSYGTYNVTIYLYDSRGSSYQISKTLKLVIAQQIPALVINTASLPSITVLRYVYGNVNYDYNNIYPKTTLSGSGGTGTGYKWSISSESLPTSLALSSTGIITGMITNAVAKTYTFTVKLTDSGNNSVTKSLSITVTITTQAIGGGL